jgi:crotonobetainyl-CoA:carnitine CoA-transferase CaiB-like acyl-CoA transferase
VAFLALNRNKKGITFMVSPGKVERLGPELGEHNAEIHGGLLGLSDHQIGKLQAEGVI